MMMIIHHRSRGSTSVTFILPVIIIINRLLTVSFSPSLLTVVIVTVPTANPQDLVA